MFDTSECPASNSNPDITGVGTRVALYVSITWGLVMTRMLLPEESDFRDVTRTAYITSTALCIAGLVSLNSNSGGISIVDGLCVTTMSSLVLVYACLSAVYWPEPEREKAKLSTFPTGMSLYTAFLLHSALWTAFGFTVWMDPTNFGGNAILTTANATCTNPDSTAEFWLFGHNVPVTSGSLRAFAMAFFAIGVFFSGAWFVWRVVYFYYFFKARRDFLKNQAKLGQATSTDEEHQMGAVGGSGAGIRAAASANGTIQPVNLVALAETAFRDPSEDEEGAAEDGEGAEGAAKLEQTQKEQSRRYAILTSYPMYFIIVLCAAAFIYLIVTTEKIIYINGQQGNTNQLSFGQILALALLLDQLFQSGTKVKEHLQRWWYAENYGKKMEEKKRAQTEKAKGEVQGQVLQAISTGL